MTSRSLVFLCALAAVAAAGCSSSSDGDQKPATSVAPSTVTVTAVPGAPATPTPTQDSPATPVVGPPPVTVTVAPPAPATVTVAPAAGRGAFQSPSGNIRCNMFTSPGDGQSTARCEVVERTWVAPPREPQCQLDWGDRLALSEGGSGAFDCYGQPLPPPESTLGYGQARSVGSITCKSDPAAMTCTDSSTGHYFRLARETYQVG